MGHDIDEDTKFCRRCGLGKAMLLLLENPPCGTFQLVAADDDVPTPFIRET